MLRLALKSLLAHKLRFAFTALAIVLGVAFVVSAFVTADSLRSTFDDLAADINTGTDFTVRGPCPSATSPKRIPRPWMTACSTTSGPSQECSRPRAGSSSTV